MTAKQSVEQLRQKYLWSRENLPSFDFPHFLFQDFFPIIFEKTDFVHFLLASIAVQETLDYSIQF